MISLSFDVLFHEFVVVVVLMCFPILTPFSFYFILLEIGFCSMS